MRKMLYVNPWSLHNTRDFTHMLPSHAHLNADSTHTRTPMHTRTESLFSKTLLQLGRRANGLKKVWSLCRKEVGLCLRTLF